MMDNEIYGLTKGQAGPTTPTGDKTKSTLYGNADLAIDPCALAISLGASWVARGFSGDVKGTQELMKKALAHKGFAFLNILSPCVTWRGEDQHKEIRAKIRPLPAGHDVTSREAALRFTNEDGSIVTTGVLYDVSRPTLVESMTEIANKAKKATPPTREDLLKPFRPAVSA